MPKQASDSSKRPKTNNVERLKLLRKTSRISAAYLTTSTSKSGTSSKQKSKASASSGDSTKTQRSLQPKVNNSGSSNRSQSPTPCDRAHIAHDDNASASDDDRTQHCSSYMLNYYRNDSTHSNPGYSYTYTNALVYMHGFPSDPQQQTELEQDVVYEAEQQAQWEINRYGSRS